MKKLTSMVIIIFVIILTGIQVQMFVLRRAMLNNQSVITQQTEVLGDVVNYLTGFGQLGD